MTSKNVIVDSSELESMNLDWQRRYQGRSKVALLPTSVEQVSAVLAHCNERGLAVVPQGGNTGQTGGSVPVFDEVIINLRKMNKVKGFDDVNGILHAQAGCVLEELEHYCADLGFQMPYTIGSRGSCLLGGNLATHAGGTKMVRHGPLRSNVVGLEAVMADGTIVRDMSAIRKDNSGYDIKQLFVGSEGTLGIITEAALRCPIAA